MLNYRHSGAQAMSGPGPEGPSRNDGEFFRSLLVLRSPPFAPVRAQFAGLQALTIASRGVLGPAARALAPPSQPPLPSEAAAGP